MGLSSEYDFRIVDRDGTEIVRQAFANMEQATAWAEQQAIDLDLPKWTLQVHAGGGWADRVSTER